MARPITSVADLRELARRRVPKMFYDYCDSGSWTESTYRSNEADFASIKLRQRVAVDMRDRTLATTMAGIPVSAPVALAPTGLTGMQHADGEILAARAADKAGVPFTLSTMSICSIEDVAENVSSPFWFQLYVMRDRDFVVDLIDRAKAAGCSALVLTLDLQILAQRHKDIVNGLSAPPRMTLPNLLNLATKPRWCANMLRTNRRTFRNIVGHAKTVTDLKSLSSWTNEQFALGAKGVFIGRAFLYGLGAMGEQGVALCLDIIRRELDVTMALCGLRDIKDVGPQILARSQ